MPQEGGDEEKNENRGTGGSVSCRNRLLFASGVSVFTTMQYEIRFCYTDGVQNVKECMQNERCERLNFRRMRVFLKKISREGKRRQISLCDNVFRCG